VPPALDVQHGIPLAPLTTLGLGGQARSFVRATDEATVAEALSWARAHALPVAVLGGGSNSVVADEGYDGLVLQMAQRGVELEPDEGGLVHITAQAGEPWEPFVDWTVGERLAGLECLAGIPGLVGASPIQNVGAYGQEVSETIRRVRVLDRHTLEVRELAPGECAFSYRDSAFKRDPGRYVVLAVTFALQKDGLAAVRYPELRRALGLPPDGPPAVPIPLEEVHQTILALRRRKSMVLDPDDENFRSAGSFFTNPILPLGRVEAVIERAVALGIVQDESEVPRFDAGPGLGKLAAGWLIERAGVRKGLRRGTVGVSSRHALALVHHGGGSTAELIALAREVRQTVCDVFGVTLEPEPRFLGFESCGLD
jgi:UDP-N-acetylmuramate dehydrogenase